MKTTNENKLHLVWLSLHARILLQFVQLHIKIGMKVDVVVVLLLFFDSLLV